MLHLCCGWDVLGMIPHTGAFTRSRAFRHERGSPAMSGVESIESALHVERALFV